MKTCCVTGHRELPEQSVGLVEEALRDEILLAVWDGYTHFISGFAAGVDLLFAQMVIELKAQYPITLEAAIPYPGRMKTADHTFQELIARCDTVKIHSPFYTKGCFTERNRYMVDCAQRVIAVYDGRRGGGTATTVRYAERASKEMRRISIPR